MTFRFPLKDVSIEITQEKRTVAAPLYADKWHQISQQEFALDVKGIAFFYAANGKDIEICPYEGYDRHTLELYLNGSVYGAILHQRKTIPIHGSCFTYEDRGIMICGESGAGKSSLTAAFCLNGSSFLTDDVSPLVVVNDQPYILTLSDRIKLWDNALRQLELQKEGLTKINLQHEKFYYPINSAEQDQFLLNNIFVLEIHDHSTAVFEMIRGAEKLTTLRNQIYRLEYLRGMPENEASFFYQLATISNYCTIMRVKRPAEIPIQELMGLMKAYIV